MAEAEKADEHSKSESMDVDEKDQDYSEVMNDPAFLQSVLQNLPGVDPQSEAVKKAVEGAKEENKDKDKKDDKKWTRCNYVFKPVIESRKGWLAEFLHLKWSSV